MAVYRQGIGVLFMHVNANRSLPWANNLCPLEVAKVLHNEMKCVPEGLIFYHCTCGNEIQLGEAIPN